MRFAIFLIVFPPMAMSVFFMALMQIGGKFIPSYLGGAYVYGIIPAFITAMQSAPTMV